MVALISFPEAEEFPVSRELEADNVLFAEGKYGGSSVMQGMSMTGVSAKEGGRGVVYLLGRV